jgi:hypothetical protein
VVVQANGVVIAYILLDLALEIIAGNRQRVFGAKADTHVAAAILGWVDVDGHHHTPCVI